MQTVIRPIHDPIARAEAVARLAAGEVIAAPTDTVYGLMCRFDCAEAIAALYEAKQRPPQKAIPVLICDLEQINALSLPPLPPLAKILAEQFWPGALTIIVPARPTLPFILTAGQPTVGVRAPDHDALRALIKASGPLAATSANLSGATEAQTAAEVLRQFAGRIPLILADDDSADQPARRQAPSTIVDLAVLEEGRPRILREGPLGSEIRKQLQM
jgi:L-threonylcarbamoyladenylate synthase